LGWLGGRSASTPLKVLVVVLVGAAILINVHWLGPAALVAGIAYLVYFGIWLLVRTWQPRERREEAVAAGQTLPVSSEIMAGRRRRWQEAAREIIRHRAPSEKLAELTGSLLLSALVVAVLTAVSSVIAADRFRNLNFAAYVAWFAVTATLGTWALLATGKALEGRSGSSMLRRFAMLVMGVLLGLAAFALGQLLMVPLRDVMDFPDVMEIRRRAEFYDGRRVPQLPAYLVYFAGLFVALRWWRLADPLRSSRFSLWATGICVLWAAVLSIFWHFPQPWGLMLVGTIAIATQVAAPWVGSKQRAEIRQRFAAAPAR
jgi:hypothetical protein